jgi:hypothetical protein
MDENTAPAPVDGAAPAVEPASVPAGQPEFSVPDGQELLSRDEAARLRRAEERAKGMQPYWETGQKAGFKDATAFEKHQQTMAALQQKGLSLDALMAAMTSDAGTEDQGDGAFDPDAFRQQIMGDLRREYAEKEHTTAEQAEMALLDDLKDLGLPENTPAEVLDGLKALARGHYYSARESYGDDHPLKGQLAPLGQEAIADKVRAPLKQFLSSFSGLKLAEIGAAAARKKASPAAGSSGAGDGTRSTEPAAASFEEAMSQHFKG